MTENNSVPIEESQEIESGEEDPILGICATLAEYQPELSALVTSLADNYIKILDKQRAIQEENNKLHRFMVVERRWLAYAIIGAVVIIVVTIVWLTSIGKFEGSTFAFFLGTSVGSLLVVLGKILSPRD